MESDLQDVAELLENGSRDECIDKLAVTAARYQRVTDLSTVSSGVKTRLLAALHNRLRASPDDPDCLSVVLFLTRDASMLEALCAEQLLQELLQIAQFSDGCDAGSASQLNAVKCLCNIVFQSQSSRLAISELEKLHFPHTLCCYITSNWASQDVGGLELLHFQCVLLFLFTAISGTECRRQFLEHPGITHAYRIRLEALVSQLQSHQPAGSDTMHPGKVLADLMKVLYTLLSSTDQVNKCENQLLTSVVDACRTVFLTAEHSTPVYEELLVQTFSVVGTLPQDVLMDLVPLSEGPGNFQGWDSQLPARLYTYLRLSVDREPQDNVLLMSVLLGLCALCRACRAVRKYLRAIILPPRKDVHNLPQEGHKLKNKLVRLMTCPSKEVSELVFELMFVLCKENVDRLLKYTGYGNAAGRMFTRGLGLNSAPAPNYSEDEPSDTEEFAQHKQGFNYVTGRYEPPKPSPFEGMSEERKVYETEKLLHALSRLENMDGGGGGLQPMSMDEEGRPVPLLDSLRARVANAPSTPPSSDDEH